MATRFVTIPMKFDVVVDRGSEEFRTAVEAYQDNTDETLSYTALAEAIAEYLRALVDNQ